MKKKYFKKLMKIKQNLLIRDMIRMVDCLSGRQHYLMIAVFPLGFLASCVSSRLPPRLTSAEAKRMSELPLPYTVGVVPYKHPAYSDMLTESLTASGVFSRVSLTSDFAGNPDFVAVVEKQVHGSAVIPAATFLTAGIVPTIVGEDHGVVFSLAPYAQRSRKIMIDASYHGTTTGGWAALPVNAFPDYTFQDPDKSERFRRWLAYRTLAALRPENSVPGR